MSKLKTIAKEPGPIAQKVIAGFKKVKTAKVVDLSILRNAHIHAEALDQSVISAEMMEQLDPLHAVYVNAQNRLSVLTEQLCELPALEKLNNAYADAQDLYLPSGPPQSPLTSSYFICWGSFDLCVGLKKETLASVTIEMCKYLQVDAQTIQVFEHMQKSRMGFYIHRGTSGKFVLLEELISKQQIKAFVPSEYQGVAGQIWLVRVFPEPFPSLNLGYSVVFTTPYVIAEIEGDRVFNCRVESLLAFFARAQEKTGIKDPLASYEFLMKYGLDRKYWNEYIFEAYVNHEHNWILLAGFPDIALSRPHSRESQKARGE
jgi:hypothetical protein